MKNPISALMSPCLNVTARCTSLALLPALLLAGCGSSPAPDANLEARLAAVEEKAEKAEARSKEALSMAMSGGSSSGGAAVEPDEFIDQLSPDDENPVDGPPSGQQVITAPPSGPQGPPMMPGA